MSTILALQAAVSAGFSHVFAMSLHDFSPNIKHDKIRFEALGKYIRG